ncbi:hypothetical protein LTR99_010424 [Exophiala xenobiotica]|uniref:PQ loop repeat protein n=1 Tax=Vermiconidia calcicola TaxID=1690605 RepID=A0AAV9PTN4_9PEZI|nr:hypothetical protein LTR99_010424 [Exophiala xenobiotica]KAK5528580.1 hypothetical protein LTR25_010193 [Vermiconidia calcicola]KAK5546005.1 hypothetical protein LTR23_003812 [Chaetothyriales sp. CCFEE 6169]KAK5336293.1 hypothetical protein LTR98_007623 [Exophiala xenobiotica]KAK5427170.1 hypothetical protein LTR34_009179 [Exophiala xenobiotica]
MDPRCAEISTPDYANFGLSLLILVGIVVSYLPQHLRIIRLRSSYGLSPYFVLLGTTSGTCAFANILVLPKSRSDVACCREIDAFPCVAGLLGVAQRLSPHDADPDLDSLLLFLIFFPRTSNPLTDDQDDPPKEELAPSYRTALGVTAISVLHAVIVAILSFWFVYARPQHTQGWANFLGIFSTVLASIQYFPQIYTTFMLKRVGSLSIPMMCIQTPGSFVWAGSLVLRYGSEGWSAWGVYLVTGCLQGCLLVMGSYFEIMHRRREKKDLQSRMAQAIPDTSTTEQTPLLRAED